MYGDDPRLSDDYGRIISGEHAERLDRLLAGHTPAFGGTVVVSERYVAPTVIDAVDPDAPIMQEEIFGPILPIVHVNSAEEARAFIRARPSRSQPSSSRTTAGCAEDSSGRPPREH